ncbi:MAG: hypothetical protein E7242_04385 [Lachnospiraceae bacterium]|nr:hypothetical protein [Lachnospiraceae bacterium]
MYENFDKILKRKSNEFHISEDEFYWIDIISVSGGFEAHIKIHDCLDDYIELTEIIDESRLRSFKEECKKAYESYKLEKNACRLTKDHSHYG